MEHNTGELTGRVLNGRYRLEELLSDGTRGGAYRATDLSSNMQVRIKLLPAELTASPGYPERFNRTVAQLTRLSHPNIVGITDAGISEEGPFVAGELTEAESLRSFLNVHGPINESLLAHLGLQICTAIHTAHSAGLLHGDLSPETILILDSEQIPEVRVIDFGLASLLAVEDSSGAVSSSGQIIGKPEYLSPEQIRGDRVTERSDIYSLGILLYEMLAGSPPFALEGKGAEAMMDLLMRQSREEPPRLEQRTPPVYVSEKLEILLFQMMEKEPIARVSSLAAVSAVLRNLEDSEESGPSEGTEAEPAWIDEAGYSHENVAPIFADESQPFEEYREEDEVPPAPEFEDREPAIDPLWQELAASSTAKESFDGLLPEDEAIESAWQDFQEEEEAATERGSEQWIPPAAAAFQTRQPIGEDAVQPAGRKKPNLKQALVITAAVLAVLSFLFSGGDDEPEEIVTPAIQEERETIEEMQAMLPNDEIDAGEEFAEAPPASGEETRGTAPQTFQPTPPTKVGIVDLEAVILRSHAGKQLAQGYHELYQKAKNAPDEQEKLKKLTEVNSRVVSQLLVDLRRIVQNVGERKNYAAILSEEGEIATAPFIHEDVEDPVGVVTATRERVNLDDEVLAEFDKLYENPDE